MRKGLPYRYASLVLAALTAMIIGLGTLVFNTFSSSPERLLATAYHEQRTLDLRIEKTAHSPVRAQLGQEISRLDRPQSLLDAEAVIGRALRGAPQDGPLLAARGVANIEEWSYESAITDMQAALDSDPRSTTILNGLAAAYFERAQSEGKFEDYGTAFELQSRALQRFYGSKTGRFMTPDWAAKPTSVPYANFGNPQSLNLYSYVQNNPTTLGDPDGHDWASNIVYLSTAVGTLGGALIGGTVGAGAGTFALPGGGTVGGGYVGGVFGAGVGAGFGIAVGHAIVSTLKAVSSSNESTSAPAASSEGSPHAPGDVPDGQVVVRGGQNPPPSSGTYSGSQGATVEEAGKGVPNGSVQVTSGAGIRAAGGDVRPAPEAPYPGAPINGQHVNITGGQTAFAPPVTSPTPKPDRLKTKPQN